MLKYRKYKKLFIEKVIDFYGILSYSSIFY